MFGSRDIFPLRQDLTVFSRLELAVLPLGILKIRCVPPQPTNVDFIILITTHPAVVLHKTTGLFDPQLLHL